MPSNDSDDNASTGTITVIYRAKVKLGDREVELGDFDSEEDAERAIILAEVEWDEQLRDGAYPPKTRKCYNCEGSGRHKEDECNMCAGTGRVSA